MEKMINKQVIEGFVRVFETLRPVVVEEAKNAASEIVEDAAKQWNDFVEYVKKNPYKNVSCIEFELLNSSKLITVAKENKVEGSNEVYVWKKQGKQNYFVYLAYGKDQEMIEQDKNKFIVIKTEGLSRDLENLFEESELVVFK